MKIFIGIICVAVVVLLFAIFTELVQLRKDIGEMMNDTRVIRIDSTITHNILRDILNTMRERLGL